MYKFFIETVGCQMNQLDSELAVSGLTRAGLERVMDYAFADVIIFNTCSIRQHAEDKVYSAIGRLKQWKLQKPFGVIGVIGCMAQKDQGKIISRAPHVDLVLGPGQLDLLAETIYRLLETKSVGVSTQPEILVSLQRLKDDHSAVKESFRLFDPARKVESRKNRFQALVRIMFGCNKFCTYCIVPKVRGPEQSRSPVEILNEVRQLVDQGVKEITFIGQTVNSYKYFMPRGNIVTKIPIPLKDVGVVGGDDIIRLSDLLYMSSEINGLRRIKFVTNYPVGMGDDLLSAVRNLPNVSKYLHIPVQSGSDAVLKRMKRQYSVAEYKELIDKIYETIPDAAVTSDFIVGFCGETEDEFRETVELVRYCRFKNSFVFKYSERPDTRSAELYADDVDESTKKRRNNELLDVQEEICLELNRKFIGRKVEILVDGETKNYDDGKVQLSGRTSCDRIVVFDADNSDLIGQFIEIEINNASPFTLFGCR
ncbi:MAG: tRNA (N6-isopentenyl adenosine(37)-C2)-methylthiotransferase MiaB [Planctomycetaceae bacterium]|jgi:tRNA-2-methylthio-N6-dimethylallyladenosine synthase|nr:tRNA (N6-isopentenyl adenosine(37)-C2)-methylthiotransferase MiaB [Planctomycetaceae bacterium]